MVELSSTTVIIIIVVLLLALWFLFRRKTAAAPETSTVLGSALNARRQRSMEDIDRQFNSLMNEYRSKKPSTATKGSH
jgi:hypothetical protein